MTLEATYKILQMKEHLTSLEEAVKVLSVADPDIIPKGSTICQVTETIEEHNNRIIAQIVLTPCTLEKEN